jgi:hypothetical protein
MQGRFLVFLLLLFFICKKDTTAQPFSFASRQVRDSITAELRAKVENTVIRPVSEQTLKDWKSACWAMELMLYKPRGFKKRIPAILAELPKQPVLFQQSFLEMLITLYPGKFKKQLQEIWQNLGSDKVKAMALEQLALAKHYPAISTAEKFYSSDYYTFYKQSWAEKKNVFPQKNDFLDTGFLKGQTVLVSFQHRNRNKPGCLMIRTASHEWMKDNKGNPLCFTQLARSIINMPWYLTNGNTPQGLHKIIGTGVSSNNWIGPTPNLQLVMPLEDSPQLFFSDTVRSLHQYKKLLGPLSNFTGLYESYYAGRIGRSEIIAHGTTIPEWYYLKENYYPCTPSLGCLCSPETWSAGGELINSVQKEWMTVVQQLAPQPVYLVVAEVE